MWKQAPRGCVSQAGHGRQCRSALSQHANRAGESQEGIKPTVQRLRAQGIGSILDYASEADVPEEDQRDLQVHPDLLQARTYDYTGEEACDENMRITLRSIAAAADVEGEYGFAAVKVTSLGPPELLRHVSQVCVDIAGTFRNYAAVEAPPVVGSALRDVGPMHTAVLTKEAFLKAMAASDVPIGEAEAISIFAEIDVDDNGRIDYLVRAWRTAQYPCASSLRITHVIMFYVCRSGLTTSTHVCWVRWMLPRLARQSCRQAPPPPWTAT